MFLKMLAVILSATLLGAMLLDMRQQRLEAMHEMAELHSRISQLRTSMWNLQGRIASKVEPQQLRAAIERAGLNLEPITPAVPQRRTLFVHAAHRSD